MSRVVTGQWLSRVDRSTAFRSGNDWVGLEAVRNNQVKIFSGCSMGSRASRKGSLDGTVVRIIVHHGRPDIADRLQVEGELGPMGVAVPKRSVLVSLNQAGKFRAMSCVCAALARGLHPSQDRSRTRVR